MLHVTNGDSAVERIRAAGIEGPVLPWRDVLHEGPVPAGLPLERLSLVRADFIASRGWGTPDEARRSFAERDRALAASAREDEVVLWFEHDLYDQLQLIQLLDWFADHPPRMLALVNPAEYLGTAAPERLAALFAQRAEVTAAQFALARAAWKAFRAPDPRHVEQVMRGECGPLPHLAPALLRLLQELPGTAGGLSRSERQLLRAFADGTRRLVDAYPTSHHAVEEAVWMGDWSWLAMVDSLTGAPTPLLAYVEDEDAEAAGPPSGPDARMQRTARMTDAGRRVLAGKADAVRMNGIDRWIGGVHLHGREVPWRWNAGESHVLA